MTSGGEGDIYLRGGVIYKIYQQASVAKEDKILQLSKLGHKNIVSPKDCLYHNHTGDFVGYSMPFVKGEVLCRFFSTDYLTRNNLGLNRVLQMVQEMADIVSAAHSNKMIMVDGNELNYIVRDTFAMTVAIDCDAWQFGPYKATVVMPSIRDYHSKEFNAGTDWFSWAVVTFQLLTGIHPYQGKHKDFKPGDMIKRMEQNVSIFSKEASFPATMRPINNMPSSLREWYKTVFEDGNRVAPPYVDFNTTASSAIHLRPKTFELEAAGVHLAFNKINHLEGTINKILDDGTICYSRIGQCYIQTTGGNGRTISVENHDLFRFEGGVVLYRKKGNRIDYLDYTTQVVRPFTPPIALDKIFVSNKRMFGLMDDGMIELKPSFNAKNEFVVFTGLKIDFNAKSTFIGEEVLIYDALKTRYLILPMFNGGCVIEHHPYLNNVTILAAKAINDFVTCLVKDRSGTTFKLEFYIDASMKIANAWRNPTDANDINFAVNDKGVAVTIVNDGELTVFSPKSGKAMTIKSGNLDTRTKLWGYKGNIACSINGDFYTLSM